MVARLPLCSDVGCLLTQPLSSLRMTPFLAANINPVYNPWMFGSGMVSLIVCAHKDYLSRTASTEREHEEQMVISV